jgi:hypothetical protein
VWLEIGTHISQAELMAIIEDEIASKDEPRLWYDKGGYRLTIAGRDALYHLDVREIRDTEKFKDEVLSGITKGGRRSKKDNAALPTAETADPPNPDRSLVAWIDARAREKEAIKRAGALNVARGRTRECAYCGFIRIHRDRNADMCVQCEERGEVK